MHEHARRRRSHSRAVAARGHRAMRALRLLPAGVPDVPRARHGDGLAARPHRAHRCGGVRAAPSRRRRCWATWTSACSAAPARPRALRACSSGGSWRRRARPSSRAARARDRGRCAQRRCGRCCRISGASRALMAALRLYERSPLRALRRVAAACRLPGALATAEASLPELPRRAIRAASAAGGPDAHRRAAHRLRDAASLPAHARGDGARAEPARATGSMLPRAQTCCGALSLHAGDRRFARELARREHRCVRARRRRGGDRELRRLRLDDEGVRRAARTATTTYATRAAAFAAMTKDVLEFVAEHELGAARRGRRRP